LALTVFGSLILGITKKEAGGISLPSSVGKEHLAPHLELTKAYHEKFQTGYMEVKDNTLMRSPSDTTRGEKVIFMAY